MKKPWASNYIYKERLAVCNSCEQYQPAVKLCKSCGCFMPAKAKIAQIRCPEDKWFEVYGTDDREPSTLSLFGGNMSNEEKSESLKRQAEHLRQESERLIKEANKLNGID